jgi:hypothetical protein
LKELVAPLSGCSVFHFDVKFFQNIFLLLFLDYDAVVILFGSTCLVCFVDVLIISFWLVCSVDVLIISFCLVCSVDVLIISFWLHVDLRRGLMPSGFPIKIL